MLTAALVAVASFAVGASTLERVNTVRLHACASPHEHARALQSSAALDATARYVLDGKRLRDAIKRSDVRALQVAVVRLRNVGDDDTLEQALRRGHCQSISDPALTEIGIASDGGRIVLVLANPFVTPRPERARDISDEVLRLVNEARAGTRRCGARLLGAAPPLALSEQLHAAAEAHARDMAAHGFLSHRGSDDSQPADRVTRTGYAWRAVGENVAAGQPTAAEVVAGWLSSPAHCANIMDADFTQMAIAYASSTRGELGVYWAQVFAARRNP